MGWAGRIAADQEPGSRLMDDPCLDELQLGRFRPEDDDYLAAVHLAAGLAPEDSDTRVHPHVASLLAPASVDAPRVDLVFGAHVDGALRCAAMALVDRGQAGLVMVAPCSHGAAPVVLDAQVQAARAGGLKLLEAIVLPGDRDAATCLAAAGYRRLTELLYLRARPRNEPPLPTSAGLEWRSFTTDRAGLFERALERSYEQSHDCPELSALRSAADALAGHRAAGVFDPSLWWVALRDGEPVGVILLTRLAGALGLELVYMGASVGARGTGVGDALLHRCFTCVRSRGARAVTLAVDSRNIPARRLYERWGFFEVGVRAAWITNPYKRSEIEPRA